jgi:hypothetical protein
VRERVGKAGSSLDGRVRGPAAIIALCDAKNAFQLIERGMLLNLADILIEDATNIVSVPEDEGLVNVKPASQNVFYVFDGLLGVLLKTSLITLEEVFLIISDLNDQGNVECILQVLGEEKGEQMTKMQPISRRASSSVEVEGLATLIVVQDELKISV